MTSELIKEIIVASVTAVLTIIPSLLLFWWAYQRDQERLIVKKTHPRGTTLEGKQVFDMDPLGPVFGILIRNLSLFPVRISAEGFEIDGKVIQLERAQFSRSARRNPGRSSNPVTPPNPDRDPDPFEIPSNSYVIVTIIDAEDRKNLAVAHLRAQKKRGTLIEDVPNDPDVIAVVVTETGKKFTSASWRQRLRRLKQKMDEESR
jgi:hypothetical protein